MKRILFIGDSITDAGRIRTTENDGTNLGFGYPAYVAADLGTVYPGEFEFLNKGISGNKILDLYARINKDVIQLRPDYMSIMIGVNDVWHNGLNEERFEQIYQWMIDDIKRELPNIKMMIITPYCNSITDEIHSRFNDGVKRFSDITKKISEKNNLAFMDTQKIIDYAIKFAPIDYWTEDGVHPTIFGQRLIANEWLRVFDKMK